LGASSTKLNKHHKKTKKTQKADVFSFGVLVFELFSRGMLLFTELPTCASSPDVTEAYAARVAAGYRPARPRGLRDAVWRLVSDCWEHDPALRPSMAQVLARLAELRSEIDGGGGGGGTSAGPAGCSCSIM
jgi:DNA-binding helix-hairpin-helix protein with protein kinase domain